MRRLDGLAAALAIALTVLQAACGSDGGGGGSGSGEIAEVARPELSSSPDFWLSSGGVFFRDGDGGRTIQGDLPPDDPWRAAYARSNPGDTDGGAHPQNVFRLVTRSVHRDTHAETDFVVRRTNPSASGNRNASNGVFLFLRYRDENNLYVGGIRVDGNVAVKKKVGGRTLTIALAKLFPGGWSKSAAPNLIPEGRAIALAAEIADAPGGAAVIRVFVDGNLALEAVDDGRRFGGGVFPEGVSGLRSDFMDVEFLHFDARDL